MAQYDPWAPYYDLLHPGLPGEAEFYVGNAVRRGGAVLEIGCGTGRICIPMAMSGLAVTGLDNAPGMLELCEEKLSAVAPVAGTLALVESDMRDFDLGQHFDTIMMPYRTFMHLLTPQDQLDCLACIHRHLTEEGVFFCNLWAARPSAISKYLESNGTVRTTPSEDHVIPEEGITLRQRHQTRFDEFHQRMEETYHLQELSEEGELLHEVTLPLTRAWVTPREMEHLLGRSGFVVEAVLGDFDGTPFSPTSTEMIWAARRSA